MSNPTRPPGRRLDLRGTGTAETTSVEAVTAAPGGGAPLRSHPPGGRPPRALRRALDALRGMRERAERLWDLPGPPLRWFLTGMLILAAASLAAPLLAKAAVLLELAASQIWVFLKALAVLILQLAGSILVLLALGGFLAGLARR